MEMETRFSYFKVGILLLVCSLHFTPKVQSAVRSPQSAVRSPQSAVRSPQSAVRSPQSAVRSPQSAVRSPQSAVTLTATLQHT